MCGEVKWKRGFFWADVTEQGKSRKELMDALMMGPVGVHRDKWEKERTWIVTHLPTGLSIFRQKTKEAAMRLGELLTREPFRGELYDIPHVIKGSEAKHTIGLRDSIWKLGGVVDCVKEVKGERA